jgi:acyl-CoA synthetase (AMP-forming)/AMP-acid ligase II
VIGVPDERTGESPKAFVVRRDSTLTEKDVFEYVAERLAAYKHIKYVEFVGSIPKSPSGKILRRELRDAERLKSRI